MLSVDVDGTPFPVLQWLKNGAALPGAVHPFLALGAVSESDQGSYTVTLTNELGSAISDHGSVTVNDPPIITQQPPAVIYALPGADVQIVAAAIGDPVPTYQWTVCPPPPRTLFRTRSGFVRWRCRLCLTHARLSCRALVRVHRSTTARMSVWAMQSSS